MICKKNFEFGKILDFMEHSENFFKKQLKNNNLSLYEYAKKISEKATISYEENEEEIQGMVIGYTENTLNNLSYITQIYVKQKYRKMGIAGKLLGEYIEYCKSVKLDGIWLTTGNKNFVAQSLYKKHGFVLDKNYKSNSLVRMNLTFKKDECLN